ncbi:fungal-specific transcription factor domain-containing protein [Daldinia sp. FL1419]|nr:fungal-specific transcription factor domain-containing protein [Daldinia sp. FL1419]
METQEKRKRHCWECRRRCLVCDFTEPTCKRCSASGIKCPGYNDAKPIKLEWLAPGRVKSRGRKRKKTLPGEVENGVVNTATRLCRKPMLNPYMPFPRFEIKADTYVVPECIEYFNSCIYRDLLPLCELGDNPHIYPLSVKHIRGASRAPDYLRLGMTCMILGHRINRIRGESESNGLVEKFYLYWGLAVASLRDHLEMEDGRKGDTMIAGIITLLLVDVQLGTSLNWRCHLEALYELIMLRGGFQAMTGSQVLKPILRCFWILAVIGDTTCPASDLSLMGSQLDTTNFLLEQYSEAMSPYYMCPLPLFAQIIKINHLRMRATKYIGNEAEELSEEAYRTLQRVHDFLPEEWADSKRSSKDWLLIGSTYQAAVAIYLILSLQSLSVLPLTPELSACCVMHSKLLRVLIGAGLSSLKTKRFMIWPLIILGVYAVHDSLALRTFVAKILPELSRDLGTSVPLTAKQVLESFWDSGETRWDACFSRPYVFTMQIAIDTAGLPHHPRSVG